MPCRNCGRYQVEVYFAGHLSLWAGKPHAREILARRSARWLWLAHALAQAVLGSVDSGRVGYVVTKGGKVVAHQPAKDQECNPAPGEDMHIPTSFSKNDSELQSRISQMLRGARGR